MNRTTRSTQPERIASTTLSAVTGQGLSDGALQPGYVGIRPKLGGPDQAKYAADFMIQGPTKHGIAGLINLYGIESPGLTSSLAIADKVAEQVGVA